MDYERMAQLATWAEENRRTIEATLNYSPFQHALAAAERAQEQIDASIAAAGVLSRLTTGPSVEEWSRRVGTPRTRRARRRPDRDRGGTAKAESEEGDEAEGRAAPARPGLDARERLLLAVTIQLLGSGRGKLDGSA